MTTRPSHVWVVGVLTSALWLTLGGCADLGAGRSSPPAQAPVDHYAKRGCVARATYDHTAILKPFGFQQPPRPPVPLSR